MGRRAHEYFKPDSWNAYTFFFFIYSSYPIFEYTLTYHTIMKFVCREEVSVVCKKKKKIGSWMVLSSFIPSNVYLHNWFSYWVYSPSSRFMDYIICTSHWETRVSIWSFRKNCNKNFIVFFFIQKPITLELSFINHLWSLRLY